MPTSRPIRAVTAVDLSGLLKCGHRAGRAISRECTKESRPVPPERLPGPMRKPTLSGRLHAAACLTRAVDTSPLVEQLGADKVLVDADRMAAYRWDRAQDP